MNEYYNEMDELNEEENDDLVLALGHFLEAHQPDHVIFNPMQCRKMLKAKGILEQMLKDHSEEGLVLCRVSPLTMQGFLSVEIESFECEDMLGFITLIQDAETFEFYPKTNGKMQFAISFSRVLIGYQEDKCS